MVELPVTGPPPDNQCLEALRRVDADLAKQSPYETVMAALDEAAQAPGAEDAAFGIAQRRFTISYTYGRPVAEVEAALRERLAVDDDPVSRSIVTGAAYATYPELLPYFEASIAELEATPRTPTIARALEAAARCRARTGSR